jgi:hypothetical protein
MVEDQRVHGSGRCYQSCWTVEAEHEEKAGGQNGLKMADLGLFSIMDTVYM